MPHDARLSFPQFVSQPGNSFDLVSPLRRPAASRQQQIGCRQRLAIKVQIAGDQVTSSPLYMCWSLVHWMMVLLFALKFLVAFPRTLIGVG